MKVKTVKRSTEPACPCGGTLQPAHRYERTETIEVRCCFSCGAETPPLYARTAAQRNGRPLDPDERICRGCERPFRVLRIRSTQQPVYCSIGCATDNARRHVKNPVWARRAS